MYTQTHTHTHTHTHGHIHIHTNTHRDTHTNTQTCVPADAHPCFNKHQRETPRDNSWPLRHKWTCYQHATNALPSYMQHVYLMRITTFVKSLILLVFLLFPPDFTINFILIRSYLYQLKFSSKDCFKPST